MLSVAFATICPGIVVFPAGIVLFIPSGVIAPSCANANVALDVVAFPRSIVSLTKSSVWKPS